MVLGGFMGFIGFYRVLGFIRSLGVLGCIMILWFWGFPQNKP